MSISRIDSFNLGQAADLPPSSQSSNQRILTEERAAIGGVSFLRLLPHNQAPSLRGQLQVIRRCDTQLTEIRSRMQSEQARLRAELHYGPPGLTAPIYWLPNRPEKPIKQALKLYEDKHKELLSQFHERVRSGVEEADGPLGAFELERSRVFHPIFHIVNQHAEDTLEKLKLSHFHQKIDSLLYRRNFEIEKSREIAATLIQRSFRKYNKKIHIILQKFDLIKSYANELLIHMRELCTLVSKFEQMDRDCDAITLRFQAAIQSALQTGNVDEVQELMHFDSSSISEDRVQELCELIDDQKAKFESMKAIYQRILPMRDYFAAHRLVHLSPRLNEGFGEILDTQEELESMSEFLSGSHFS